MPRTLQVTASGMGTAVRIVPRRYMRKVASPAAETRETMSLVRPPREIVPGLKKAEVPMESVHLVPASAKLLL